MKKGAKQYSTPAANVLDHVQAFITICNMESFYEEWDVAPFLEGKLDVKALSKNQIFAFVDLLSEFFAVKVKNGTAIDYPQLEINIDKYIVYKNKCAKNNAPVIKQMEEIQDKADNELSRAEYRAQLTLFILKKLIPQFQKLYENERQDLTTKVLSFMFAHLSDCVILRGKRYLSAGILSDEVYLDENIKMFLEFAQLYVSNESKEVLLQRAPRILKALEIIFKYQSLVGNAAEAQTCQALFQQTLSKAQSLLKEGQATQSKLKKKQPSILLDDLEYQLTQAQTSMPWAEVNFTSHPWVSLFNGRREAFESTPETETAVLNVDAVLDELLAESEKEAEFNADYFASRLVAVITQFENIPQEKVTIPVIISYVNFLDRIANEFKRKALSNDLHLDLLISALLIETHEQFVDDKINGVFQDCANFLNQERTPVLTLTQDDFIQSCIQLTSSYRLYSQVPNENRDAIEHLELVKRLKQLIIQFKNCPIEDLTKEVVDTFHKLILNIMMFKIDVYYKEISKLVGNEVKSLKAKEVEALANLLNEKLIFSDDEPLAGIAVEGVNLQDSPTPESKEMEEQPILEHTPVLTRSPTPEFKESEEEPNIEHTPVLTRSPTPEIVEENLSDAVDELAKQIENTKLDDAIVQAQLAKTEINEQIASLSTELTKARETYKQELVTKSQMEVEDFSALLAKKESDLLFKNAQRLRALEQKNKTELDKKVQELQLQSDKEIKKIEKTHADTLKKKARKHLKAKAALEENAKIPSEAFKQKREAQQAELVALQARFTKELEDLPKEIIADPDCTEQDIQHQAKVDALKAEFAAKKAQARSGLLAQHEALLAADLQKHQEKEKADFDNFRRHFVHDLIEEHKAQKVALSAQLQQAQTAFSANIRADMAVLSHKVVVPLLLVPLLNRPVASPYQPLSLADYINRLRKLFLSPWHQDNYNVTFNLCFLRNLLPTVPYNYTQLMTVEHPHLNSFIRMQLQEINTQEFKHISSILAPLLLIPILTRHASDNIDKHIENCINDFLACFDASNESKVELRGALLSVLKDTQTDLGEHRELRVPGLYRRYCQYAANCVSSAEQFELAKSAPRGYFPQYATEPQLAGNLPETQTKQLLKKSKRTLSS